MFDKNPPKKTKPTNNPRSIAARTATKTGNNNLISKIFAEKIGKIL
jgi:hypothetical protein